MKINFLAVCAHLAMATRLRCVLLSACVARGLGLRVALPRAHVRIGSLAMCAAERPSIGGTPVELEDGLLCRDEASDAWWRATVIDMRPSEVKVHYMGCDPSWDAWIPADSPDVYRMDPAEAQRSSFHSDEMPSDITDSELLDAYRQKQWDANARWQLSTFAQSHLGAWSGSLALYRPERRADGTIGFVESASHSSATSVEALVAEDGCVRWKEALGLDPATPLDSSGDLTYASFDRYAGCSAVGGAYTLMRKREGGRLLFEIGMREEGQRVRCKFVYKPASDTSDDPTSDPTSDQTPVELEELAIIREALGEGAAYAPAVSSAGGGLYDPPPLADRTDYCSLYCTGGLTLVFPARCDAAAPGFLSADWISGRMRYQADRKFQKLDGTLSSLELSEIQTEDAERFPSEKTQPGR